MKTLNKNVIDQLRNQANDKGEVFIDTGYTPRALQAEIHRNLRRFNVLVIHRRFGKTVLSLNEMLDRGLRNNLKNPQYAYIAPSYKQAKSIAWDYLKDFTRTFPGISVHEQELTVKIPRYNPDGSYRDRIKLVLIGSENPDSLRGMYLDGAVLDEFAQCDPIIWGEVVRPMLADRKGWAIFIGTPKGQNHFFDLWRTAMRLHKETDIWYTKMVKASESMIIDKTELKSARMEMKESEYQQEFECSFEAALTGAYYAKELNKVREEDRITTVPYDKTLGVYTFWDLGMNDKTAVWFAQFVGKEIHLIDHIEADGKNIEDWVKIIKEKPYIYERHYIPHDGAARELGTGVTRQERFLQYGLRTDIVPRQNVQDGIDAVRSILDQCWFDADKTEEGFLALKNYRKSFDSKKNMFSDKPLHDWASDSADAFRMLALVYNPDRMGEAKKRNLPRMAKTSYNW